MVMSGKTLAIIGMIAFLSLAIAATLLPDDSEAAAETYTVKGYIGEIGDSGITPYEGLEVGIYQLNGAAKTLLKSGKTDSEGYYEFDITTDSLDSLLIKLYEEGLSVPVMLPCMDTYSEEGYYTLNLTSCKTGNICTISKDLEHCIAMSDTKVPVYIHVTGKDNEPLKGATVTVYHDGIKKYTGETDSNGICEISSKLPIGDYDIEAHCPGYESQTQQEHVSLSSATFILSLQEKEISTYAGMTVYHILMVVSVGLGLILALAGYILCRHNWAHVDDEKD